MKKQEIFTRYGATVPGLESMPGLMADLRQCDDVREADAVIEMVACQVVQTGYAGRGKRATAEQREWARGVDAARQEREARDTGKPLTVTN